MKRGKKIVQCFFTNGNGYEDSIKNYMLVHVNPPVS